MPTKESYDVAMELKRSDSETLVHCGRCGLDKPQSEFYLHSHNGRPRKPCKACLTEQRRGRYASNNGVDRAYAELLRREYGLTLDDYNQMVRAQGNRCAICKRPETATYKSGRVKRLAVDHDHATNQVRALLCHRCNLLVWALEDNHTTLSSVEAYVEKHRETFANGAPI